MSEQGTQRRDVTEIDWAQNDQTNVGTIDSGLMDAGHPTGDDPTSMEHNKLFYEYRNILGHLLAQTPRVFDSLAEALDAINGPAPQIAAGELFRVRALDGSGNRRRPGQTANTIAAGGAVLAACTDGQRVFYGVGANVYGTAGLGGAASGWGPKDPTGGDNILLLETDGQYLYVGTQGDAVRLLQLTDGENISGELAIGDTPTDLAANGVYLVIANADGGGDVDVYDTLGASPALVGSPSAYGAVVNAVTLDRLRGYMGGEALSGVVYVRAFDLASPGGFYWSSIIPGANAVKTLEHDGSFIYVGTEVNNVGDCVFCLRREDGEIVWSTALPGADGVASMALDDRYVWVTDDNAGDVWILERGTGAIVGANDAAATAGVQDADGHVAVAIDGTDVVLLFKGEISTDFLYQPVNVSSRRPTSKIAQPVEVGFRGGRRIALGDQVFFQEETTPASAGTTTPVVHQNWTTQILKPGYYLVLCFATHRNTTINTQGGVRFVAGGANLYPNDHQYEPDFVPSTRYVEAFRVLQHAGGTLSGSVQAIYAAGDQSVIDESSVLVMRLV